MARKSTVRSLQQDVSLMQHGMRLGDATGYLKTPYGCRCVVLAISSATRGPVGSRQAAARLGAERASPVIKPCAEWEWVCVGGSGAHQRPPNRCRVLLLALLLWRRCSRVLDGRGPRRRRAAAPRAAALAPPPPPAYMPSILSSTSAYSSRRRSRFSSVVSQ